MFLVKPSVLKFVLPISIPFLVSFALWMDPVLVIMNLIIYSIDNLVLVRTSRV